MPRHGMQPEPVKQRCRRRAAHPRASAAARGHDAEAGSPCSLDVLTRWSEQGDNFKVFQHGIKGKKKSSTAKMESMTI